ncbi:helix-turn-helix domain-containing protein [Methyloligella solikamskensis]|uniref:Helix-turn-helix domain-containing protein n=1 Tax=Methyloligella solikamskensis TaxID=1177756 RepID=A0ABW3J7I8_9HYPH
MAALRGPAQSEPIKDIGTVLENDQGVGREIKDLRKASDVTLSQLAKATGLSQGYLSQIERGISSPSIKALHSISRALGVNISWFFPRNQDESDELDEYIVRRKNRRQLKFESGITDELLSPNLGRGIELLRCTFAPHSESGTEPYEHRGEEAGIVISGALTLWLGGRRIDLETGDSFAFESTIPHRYANEGDEEAVLIWSISPPSY